jgi:hypothetical protein
MRKTPRGAGLLSCLFLTLALSFFVGAASAQPNYSGLFLANQNGTGAVQSPLSLGNWGSPQTTTPSFAFNTSDNGTSFLDIHATRWGSSVTFSRSDPSNNSYNLMSVYGYNGAGATLALYNSSNAQGLLLNAQGTTYFTGGAVAIGTTNPGTSQLAVQGTIETSKVVVTATSPFPDFVFDPGYRLPSLDSLDNYIRTNRHLPEMPTADSVDKIGLDLGNSQIVLVKKIEELTLYLIEQDKEMKLLKEKIGQLEEQLNKDVQKK